MTVLAPSRSDDRRVVIDGVSWEFYERMLVEVGERPIRLTYDDGTLEIMTLSPLHERVKKVLARLIETYSDALGLGVEGLGSTTFRREDLRKGLEPDECYYVANARAIIGKDEIDLAVDPPPDLALEIDICPPDVERQPIYAALGIPEVWRYDGSHLVPLLRTDRGTYVAAERSRSFPNLPIDKLNRLLAIGLAEGQSAAVRALREWMKV
jgi:Uma2 family endonuclease